MGLGLRHGRDLGRCVARLAEESGQSRLAGRQVARHRLEASEQRAQLAERGVDLRAAAGEDSTELDEVLADCGPGPPVEGAEDLVVFDGARMSRGERER